MTNISAFVKKNSVLLTLVAIGLLFSLVSGQAGKPAASCPPGAFSCTTALPDAP